MHYLYFEKRQPPEKGLLFSYRILLKRRDGIIENDESLAGGWYKFISDYLILSYYLRDWEFWYWEFVNLATLSAPDGFCQSDEIKRHGKISRGGAKSLFAKTLFKAAIPTN